MNKSYIALGFAVVLALAGSFLAYHNHVVNEKATAEIAANTSPTFFQPEAAMLTQAISTTDILASGTIQAPLLTGTPNPADVLTPTTTPYSYTTNVCYPGTSAQFLCFAAFYKQLTDNYGVNIAIDDIETRYNQNAEVESDCHPLMHIIGQEASLIYPTVSDAYLHGNNFCWSGYYHGILEGVVGRIGLAALPAQMNTICAAIPGKATYDFNYYNCVHGLGHGVMEVENDNVSSSLGICDDLTGTWEQESCYSGVFMENIISYDHNGTSTWLNPSDPLYPCDALGDKYKSECYLGQTSYALQITNYNFPEVFSLCSSIAEPYRDICNQSAGRDAANQAEHAAQQTKTTCEEATTPNDVTNCVIGAAKEIVSYYSSDVQAKAFCSILDGSDAATCLSTTESYYQAF